MPREDCVALCECGTLLWGRDRWELEAAARRCFAEHPREPVDSPRGMELRGCLAHVLTRLSLVSQADAGSYGLAPADRISDPEQRGVGSCSHPYEEDSQFAQARAAWPQPGGVSSRRSAPGSRGPSGGVDRGGEHNRFWRLRSVEYFRERLSHADCVRDLELLVEEAWESLEAWQGRDVIALALGDEPGRDDSRWKVWVALSPDSPEEVARKSRSGVSLEEVVKIQRDYLGALGVRSFSHRARRRERAAGDPERLPAPPLIGVRRGDPDERDIWDDDIEYRREADLRPSPHPLVEIRPSRPGRVPPHPYAGSVEHEEQYGQQLTPSMSGREGRRLYIGPSKRRPEDNQAILEWAFGELGEGADPRWDAHYGIEDTGRTGAPGGRPRHGTADGWQATLLILDRCPGRTIEELRGCISDGRPNANMRPIHDALSVAVSKICEARLATRDGLAAALECNVRAVHRLRAKGDRLRALACAA